MLVPESKDLLVNPDRQASKDLKENKGPLVLKDLPVIKDLRVPPGLLGLLVVADRVTVLQKDTHQAFYRLITRVDMFLFTPVLNRKDSDA
jgi:hypothetical protein